ncbi:hypothetical protein KAW50_03480 [candidate division WOR-3 bacterium]|nr:hypothetical protein [candidate division WOR-3 bacterium]
MKDQDSRVYHYVNIVDDLAQQAQQVSIAYNGLELEFLVNILDELRWSKGNIVNITTNPMFLNEPLLALFARYKVKMIALSLDKEKCTVNEWILKAKEVKTWSIKVGANILMLDEMYNKIPDVLKKIHKYCDQIHLLRPKFYTTKIPLEKRKEMVFLLKQRYKNLFIDECFRWEFLGKPCRRGKDFISINPDGSVSLCSFDLLDDNDKNLKKCPYI